MKSSLVRQRLRSFPKLVRLVLLVKPIVVTLAKPRKTLTTPMKVKSVTDGGAQEKDRASKGTGAAEDRKKVGKGTDVSRRWWCRVGKSLELLRMGSGKAIKSPSVRVMKVGAKANFAESAEFSELTARLEQLEAANAKLVQEKVAAEQHAHRLQLERLC